MYDIPKVPPGWTLLGSSLIPDGSLSGAAQRGADVRGVCQRQDCRRTCWVEPRYLVERGLGAVSLNDYLQTLLCGRLGGCSIEWRHHPLKAAVSFGRLSHMPGVGIAIRCIPCGVEKKRPVAAMLEALRRKDPASKIDDVDALLATLKRPCAKCGKVAWQVDIRWPRQILHGGGARIVPGWE